MKYYLDTEFHEYQRKPLFSKPFRTIDLISIGIVAEDGREYYAISKDFDLKAAWNSYQLGITEDDNPDEDCVFGLVIGKNYWLRDNVLKPIWIEFGEDAALPSGEVTRYSMFTYKELKYLINKYGKSNAQIAEEVIGFVTPTNEPQFCVDDLGNRDITYQATKRGGTLPDFYAYYADYDWVVFCWLFGKMIDLPKGFPMYCRDLKQMLDEKCESFCHLEIKDTSFDSALKRLKNHPDYPKQSNEHNALTDAKWNKELHKFIEKL